MKIARWRDWPLPTKIGALVIALALGPLVLLTLITAFYNRESVLESARQRNLRRAHGTAQVIDTILNERLTDLGALAGDPAIVAIAESSSHTRGQVAHVNGILARTRDAQDLGALFIVGQSGEVVASTAPSLIGHQGLAARLLTRALAGEPVLEGPRYNSGDGVLYVRAAYPIVDSRQSVVGAVVGRFTMEQISQAIAGDTNFAGGETYGMLLDADGVRLSVPSRPELLFRPVDALPDTVRAELLGENRFGPRTPELVIPSGLLPGLATQARWLRYQPDSYPHVRVAPAGVEPHVVTLVPLAQRNWTYAIVARESDLLIAWKQETERALGVLLLAALLTIIGATAAVKWLTGPLSLVVDAARALGAGELHRRVGLRQPDEVGQLAAAFDSMADAIAAKDLELRRHADRLEAEVEARTAALRASEEEMRAVLRAVPDLMFRADAAGRLVEHLSDPATEFHPGPELSPGESVERSFPPEAAERARAAIARALAHRRLEVFEYEWRPPERLDDEGRIYEARVYPDGTETVLCMVRDVTQRRRSEAETRFLAEATARLAESLDVEQILERLAHLLVPAIADLGTIDLVEDGRLKTVAVAASEREKREIEAEIRRRYPIDLDGPHPVAVAVRERRSQLVRVVTPDHQQKIAVDAEHLEQLCRIGARSVLAVPLVARGAAVGVIGLLLIERRRSFGEDDRRRVETLAERAVTATENARLYRELQIANRMKDEFLGIVSHELRTPLNAVLGWSRLLQEGSLGPDRAAHALAAIHRNAQAQRQLIEDLLDASRIISGKMRLEEEPLRLGVVLESAIDAVRPAVEARRQSLTTDLSTAHEAVIEGDPQRLQQVFWNLLSNATKFTPEEGHISVASVRKRNWIEINVTDTGAGIDGSFLPYVFERFQQADSTTTRAHGGLGLGLAIARHVTEQHGGTISAWSAGEGRGSTFTVRLPVQPASVLPGAAVDRSGALSVSALPGPLRVLVVDNDPDSRELLRTVLASSGAVVRTAGSAEEAIGDDLLEPPDVLISDIGMPHEDGYAFLARLRRLEAGRGSAPVPAIAVTAYARAEDRRRALDAGYLEHLGKPVDPGMLLQSVRRAAEQRGGLSAGGRSH